MDLISRKNLDFGFQFQDIIRRERNVIIQLFPNYCIWQAKNA